MKRILPIIAVFLLITLVGCSAKSVKPDEKYITYSGEMPKQITKSDMKGDNFEISEHPNHQISIFGDPFDFAIESDDDAFRALASLIKYFGIDDFASEIFLVRSSSDKFNTVYTFGQLYRGIELKGRALSITVDTETHRAEHIYSGYFPDIKLDTAPGITAEKAVGLMYDQYKIKPDGEPSLVVYIHDTKPCLTWFIETTGEPYEVYISASDGEILKAEYPADYFGGA